MAGQTSGLVFLPDIGFTEDLTMLDWIVDEATLEAMFPPPAKPSVLKVTAVLTPSYRRMIEASPFFVIATSGAGGIDCSPRGDAAGFVRVVDSQTLLLPERRGNNRLDTLRNLIHDPRVSLLFLIPGVAETLRVSGTAVLTRNPQLCASFTVHGKVPAVVIAVTIEAVYFQCARAIVRSKLWDPATFSTDSPSAGTMLADASSGAEGGPAYDKALPERIRTTLY